MVQYSTTMKKTQKNKWKGNKGVGQKNTRKHKNVGK